MSWSAVLSAVGLLGAVIVSWANIKSDIRALSVLTEARHRENIRRFESLERERG